MFCPIKSRKKNLLKSLFTKILLKMYLLPYLCPYIRESTCLPHCVGEKRKSYHICEYIVLLRYCIFFFFLTNFQLLFVLLPPFSPQPPLWEGGGVHFTLKKTYTVELFKFCIFKRSKVKKLSVIAIFLDLAHSFKEIQLKLECKCTKVVQPLRGRYIFGVLLQRKVCTLTVLHNQRGF